MKTIRQENASQGRLNASNPYWGAWSGAGLVLANVLLGSFKNKVRERYHRQKDCRGKRDGN